MTGGGSTVTPAPVVTSWVQGQFPAEALLKNYCANPRSGNDPYNDNQPYPDKAGDAGYEKMWQELKLQKWLPV